MEKTIQITIGSTVFSLTESAYGKLAAYLDSLKKHFEPEAESAEIMRDIESRIAEKLLPKRHAVVTDADIEAIIAEIGHASQFDDATEAPAKEPASRKLYRDMDNAVLGGVAAGIGAYFDIDPIWVRLLFIVSVFFGGTGVILYIALWILVPEAKSAGQKLEMRGAPVDIEGISRVVKERVEHVRDSGALRQFSRGVNRLVSGFFRVLGKFSGALLVAGSFAAFIAVMLGFGIVATNWNAPYNDFPLRDVVSQSLLVSGLIAGFVTVLIPLIAIFALGVRLIKKRTVVPSAIAFGLVGIWAVALSATGTIAVRAAGEYFEYTRTNPDYQQESRQVQVGEFSRIDVSGIRATVRSGAETSITVEGRAMDLENASVDVVNGTLVIRRSPSDRDTCLFCDERMPEVIVTAPDLDEVSVERATAVFDDYEDADLAVSASGGSIRGTLIVRDIALSLDASSLHGVFESADTVAIDAKRSHIELDGEALTASLTLDDTHFDGDSFRIENATISFDDTYARLYVTGELTREREESSFVENSGARTD